MKKKALLVDYNMCDGCRLCVEVCCREHGCAEEQSGIILSQVGPYRFPSGKEETYFIATPTDFCDQCESADSPACVSVCPEQCLKLGDVQDLGKRLIGKKKALFVLSNRVAAQEEIE